MTFYYLKLNLLSLNLSSLIVIGLILCIAALIVYIIAPTLPKKNSLTPIQDRQVLESTNPLDFFKTNAIITSVKTIDVDNQKIQMIDLGNGKILLLNEFDYYPCPENERKLEEILKDEEYIEPQKVSDTILQSNTVDEKLVINSTFDEAREMEEIFQNANPDDFNYALQRELNEEASKIEVNEPEILTQENEENDQFHFSFEVDENPNNNI